MKRGLVLLILALLSTGPARAACEHWQWPGNYTFIQANGFRPNVGISREDGKLHASAVHDEIQHTSEGNVGHGVYGGGDVTAQGTHLYVTIAWNNGLTGIYEGDIGADGRVYGLTWDARSAATKVKWHTEEPIACAPAPAKPPADVLGAHMENNIDRPGSDYTNFVTPTPAACQAACSDQLGKCRAWSFVRPGVQGETGRCYLKSAAPAPVPNKCCISGTGYRTLGKKVPATSQAPSPPLMAGTFDTSFGLLQLGPNDGTYSHENGRVTVENTHDNIVEGTWEQNSAGTQCPDGRYRGKFVFAFTSNSFTGFYGYCDDPPTAGAWNGTRR